MYWFLSFIIPDLHHIYSIDAFDMFISLLLPTFPDFYDLSEVGHYVYYETIYICICEWINDIHRNNSMATQILWKKFSNIATATANINHSV